MQRGPVPVYSRLSEVVHAAAALSSISYLKLQWHASNIGTEAYWIGSQTCQRCSTLFRIECILYSKKI